MQLLAKFKKILKYYWFLFSQYYSYVSLYNTESSNNNPIKKNDWSTFGQKCTLQD